MGDPKALQESLQKPVSDTYVRIHNSSFAPLKFHIDSGFYLDKIQTGFLAWTTTIDVHEPAEGHAPFQWDSEENRQVIADAFEQDDFIQKLMGLLGQESSSGSTTLSVRNENASLFKYLGALTYLFCTEDN